MKTYVFFRPQKFDEKFTGAVSTHFPQERLSHMNTQYFVAHVTHIFFEVCFRIISHYSHHMLGLLEILLAR